MPANLLPVEQHQQSIIDLIETHARVILSSPPGSGKTTRVPLILSTVLTGKIIVVQPRRVAAKSVAECMSQLLGDSIGNTVGYHVRFDKKCHADTRIEVVTEGILIRRLLADQELAEIECVVLDEFHERHVNSDLIFAMLKELQSVLRPDLKVVLMSATLNTRVLSQQCEAQAYEIDVRQYPIQMIYQNQPSSQSIIQQAVTTIEKAWRQHCAVFLTDRVSNNCQGHLLAFFTGRREILSVKEALLSLNQTWHVDVLMGSLSLQEQSRVLTPKTPARIILATNIAETSLTIPGVIVVVDTGRVKVNTFTPTHHLSRLEVKEIAVDASQQRAGRAGRTQAGICYRLWSEHKQQQKDKQTLAEIHRSDLSSTLLYVAYWSGDWRRFEWFDPPQRTFLNHAVERLRACGFVDQYRVTALGKAAVHIPLPIHATLALLYASVLNCVVEVADLLTFLEDEFNQMSTRQLKYMSQILVQQLKHITQNEQIIVALPAYDSLYEYQQHTTLPITDKVAIAFAWSHPHWVAQKRQITKHKENKSNSMLLAMGSEVYFDQVTQDTVASNESEYSICLQVVSHKKKLHSRHILPLKRESLLPKAHMVTGYLLDEAQGIVYQVIQKKWLHLVVSSHKKTADPQDEFAQLLLAAYIVENPVRRLPLSKDLQHWIQRVRFVGSHLDRLSQHSFTTSTWPMYDFLRAPYQFNYAWLKWNQVIDIDDDRLLTLLDVLPETMRDLCAHHVSLDGLKHIHLKQYIQGLCPYDIVQFVDKVAPTYYILPTGQKSFIHYQEDAPPYIEAYVQAFFGESIHPMLGGSIPLQLQLLAPNRRVTQTTSDLPHFWQHSYQDVRKELRGRYPKHHWPEDPLSMPAQSRTKSRSKT